MGYPMSPAMGGHPMGYPMSPAMGGHPMMGPMGYPMMGQMGYPMMDPAMMGQAVAPIQKGKKGTKKQGITGKLDKLPTYNRGGTTYFGKPPEAVVRTFHTVNSTRSNPKTMQITNNLSGSLIAPRYIKLEKARTVGRETIYDLLQQPSTRQEFTSIILDMLIENGTGISVIAPLPEHPSIQQNYYLNFNVNGIHLSIHYDRASGGMAGHIHVTNDSEICRILMLYDAITNEHFIGGCYKGISEELAFLTNICVDAIIILMARHRGLEFIKKEICNT